MVQTLLIALILSFPGSPSARSLSLGGIPLSGYGEPATGWINPALLALEGQSYFQLGHLNLPIGFPAVALNINKILPLLNDSSFLAYYKLSYYIVPLLNSKSNVFSPEVLYEYFYSGKTLTDEDKSRFLALLDDGYASLNTRIDLFNLNLASGGFNISLSHITAAKLHIPAPLFELLFYGNELNRTYSFDTTNTYFESLNAVVLSVAYSHKFVVKNVPVAVGGGLRFTRIPPFKTLMGQGEDDSPEPGYIRLKSLDLSFYADTEKIVFNGGRVEFLNGAGQVGTGIDLGVAVMPYPGVELGLALVNIGSNIAFTDRDSIMVMELSSDTINGLSDSVEIDVDTVYQIPANGEHANLPQYVHLTASYKAEQLLFTPSIGIALSFSLKESAISSKGTRFSIATELHPTNWLPIRMSLITGDPDGLLIGYGFGIRIKRLHWDLGFQNIGGLGVNSRGGQFITDFWLSI